MTRLELARSAGPATSSQARSRRDPSGCTSRLWPAVASTAAPSSPWARTRSTMSANSAANVSWPGRELATGRSEQVDHEGGPVGRPLVRAEDAGEPAGLHRRRGERALGVQRPLQLPAFLTRPPREDRLRDGDERHPVRDGQQRQAGVLGRPDQALRGRLVAQVRAEPQAEARTPAAHSPAT